MSAATASPANPNANGGLKDKKNQFKALASQDSSKVQHNASNSNSASSPLASLSDEVSHRLSEALEKTKAEVRDLQARLLEYDERYQASSSVKAQGAKASEFLSQSLSDTRSALDSLATNAKILLDRTQEVPVKAFTRAFAALNSALERLIEAAKEFDEQYKISAKVSDIVSPARQRLASLVTEASGYATDVSNATHAQLRGVHEGLKGYIKGMTSAGLQYLLNTAASLDTKYDIETKVTGVAKDLDERFHVVDKVKEVNEKYKVVDMLERVKGKGKELDVKITDGKATELVQEAYTSGLRMVTTGFEKIQKDFDDAKRNSRENLQEATN